MKNISTTILALLLLCTHALYSASVTGSDSIRIAELNQYWNTVAETVETGDFEGYSALYHSDAIVIFTTGDRQVSMPISKALANWKDGFMKTKTGKQKDTVEFRFSQRINDETTAHETGLFKFTSFDNSGNVQANAIVRFEGLLVKKDNVWYMIMEYQKSLGTEEEWEALE